MKKILLLLVVSLVSTQILAVDDTENVSTAKAGDKKGVEQTLKGNSQGAGYHVKFTDSKDADFHLWGLGRMYFYPASPNRKAVMPYFRFNLDAQKDKNWSMHARLDYGQYIKGEYYKLNNEDPADALSGAPTFYFSRAYLSYKFDNSNIKLSAGRMLNQAVKYDVLDKYTAFDYKQNGSYVIPTMEDGKGHSWTDSTYHTGEGVRFNYNDGTFEATATITYEAGTNYTEKFFYSGYLGHNVVFNKDARFEYGVGASTSTHDKVNPQYLEVLPNIGFFYKDFYVIDQFMARDLLSKRGLAANISTEDYELLMRNHLEVGKTFNIMSKDVTFDAYLASVMYDSESVHNVGLEAEVKMNDRLSTVINTQYDNVGESDIEKAEQHDGLRRLSYYAYINYYF